VAALRGLSRSREILVRCRKPEMRHPSLAEPKRLFLSPDHAAPEGCRKKMGTTREAPAKCRENQPSQRPWVIPCRLLLGTGGTFFRTQVRDLGTRSPEELRGSRPCAPCRKGESLRREMTMGCWRGRDEGVGKSADTASWRLCGGGLAGRTGRPKWRASVLQERPRHPSSPASEPSAHGPAFDIE